MCLAWLFDCLETLLEKITALSKKQSLTRFSKPPVKYCRCALLHFADVNITLLRRKLFVDVLAVNLNRTATSEFVKEQSLYRESLTK